MTEPESEKNARKHNSREALQAAADKLFVQKGYQAVSTRELAEAAQVNLGTITYHFGSKAQLFMETVKRMMKGTDCASAMSCLKGECSNSNEAGAKLCMFVSGFLDYLLRPTGPQVCRLMFREILSDTSEDKEMMESLVSNFVEEFTRPSHETLVEVLKKISEKSARAELDLIAQSVIGQCTFYVTHLPFIQRLHGRDFSSESELKEVCEHICRFSLRALGCSEEFITQAYKNSLMGKSCQAA